MHNFDLEHMIRLRVYKRQLQATQKLIDAGWKLTVNEFKHEVWIDPVHGSGEEEQVAVEIQELRDIQRDYNQPYLDELAKADKSPRDTKDDHDQLLLFDYPDV